MNSPSLDIGSGRVLYVVLAASAGLLIALGAAVIAIGAKQAARVELRNSLFDEVTALWQVEVGVREGYESVVLARLAGDADGASLGDRVEPALRALEDLNGRHGRHAGLAHDVREGVARIDGYLGQVTGDGAAGREALASADAVRRELIKTLADIRERTRGELNAAAHALFDGVRQAHRATITGVALCVAGLVFAGWVVHVERTRRTQVERLLRESAQRLEEAERVARLGNWIHDRVTGALTGSAEYYRLWGLSPGAPITAETVFERIHPDDLPEIQRIHAELERNPRPMRLEFRARVDGQVRRFVAHVTPRTDTSSGRVIATFGTLQDVSDLSEAQDALRQSEARLRAVIRATRQVVYDWDAAADVVRIEGACEEVLGVAPGEFGTPAKWESLIHPDDLSRFRREVQRAVGEKKPFQLEYRMRRADGTYVPVLDRGTYLETPSGATRQIGTILDLSDRKRLEQELLQAQKLESIGRLAGGVAHDFNNYLTAILGYVDLIRSEAGLTAGVLEHLGRIEEAGQGAARLTGQLLAYARRQTIEPRVCSLNDVVHSASRLLSRLLRENIKLEVRPASDLWMVRVDPGQFEQIVVNLAINARDAMPNGGRLTIETANVTLSADYAATHPEVTPGEHVMLAITDTGSGIPAKNLPHIFEPFFTTKRRGEGTGLGLATVLGLVKQHRGHIWVYSEVGKGTTFKIYLPRESAGEEERGTRPAPPRATTGNETVLVVEDEPLVRGLAVGVLSKAGYRVLEAPSAREAIELARTHHGTIHLLLTDVVLPEMSGKQIAEAVRAQRPETRVLYTSGYTDNVVVHHGILDPGVEFLPKPYAPSALAAKVREVLDK